MALSKPVIRAVLFAFISSSGINASPCKPKITTSATETSETLSSALSDTAAGTLSTSVTLETSTETESGSATGSFSAIFTKETSIDTAITVEMTSTEVDSSTATEMTSNGSASLPDETTTQTATDSEPTSDEAMTQTTETAETTTEAIATTSTETTAIEDVTTDTTTAEEAIITTTEILQTTTTEATTTTTSEPTEESPTIRTPSHFTAGYVGTDEYYGIGGTGYRGGSYQAAVYPGYSHIFYLTQDGRMVTDDGFVLSQDPSDSSASAQAVEMAVFSDGNIDGIDPKFVPIKCRGLEPDASGVATIVKCYNPNRSIDDVMQICEPNSRSVGFQVFYIAPELRDGCVETAITVTASN
ncbi:hypothetical protein NW768_007626 [Fusarium equiseti]|uniref:Uncharacterized protein n=1 Tax=Fusarium equiseti TaxID=61235 RepID=A0ABQ8R811_FUSEQ|nr:hypothetical protein NW768_007626 [Fusarium equiseti]